MVLEVNMFYFKKFLVTLHPFDLDLHVNSGPNQLRGQHIMTMQVHKDELDVSRVPQLLPARGLLPAFVNKAFA